ncbi:MAG TPA: hypothetical protein VFY03_10210, partial [Woeseiaceae bacterium]|nr:hypothetical protein [Woeseiaceae bacterium]
AEEFDAMRDAAERALAARPGYPAALFNLALAQVHDGDAAAALATLQPLAAQQIDLGIAAAPEFAPLQEHPAWPRFAASMAAAREPVGAADEAWTHPVGDFVPEGIAVAPGGREAWIGSIRFGTIQRLGGSDGVVARPGPHWSVYGMRLRGDRLWFVSAAVGQFAALDAADAGRTGLFSVDANGGVSTAETVLPTRGGPQVLGDLEFGPDGDVFLADQAGGIVYRYEPDEGRLSALTEPGRFVSPQGVALAADGQRLYVADYARGLFRLDTGTGVATQVPADAATSLYGIDGLYRYGNSLIAIQNGIQPNRVVLLELSADGTSVAGSRILAMNLPAFDEPNLGQVLGDDFYFIANSHWNRFDADGNLPAGLAGPVVLRLRLPVDR